MKKIKPAHDSAATRSFACLLFNAADTVGEAEILFAPRKAVAMQRAMSRLHTREDVVGFQLWQDGFKVAEFFPERHRAAGRMVSGPIARRKN